MSIRVNLLPWRAQRREQKKKRFFAITLFVFAAVAGVCAFYQFQLENHTKSQNAAIALLDAEIKKFENLEKRQKEIENLNKEITQQIVTISVLQDERTVLLRILEFFAEKTPDSVFLNSLNKNGRTLQLNGLAENEDAVAQLMRLMEDFELFQTPRLTEMRKARSTDRYSVSDSDEVQEFRLIVSLREKQELMGQGG